MSMCESLGGPIINNKREESGFSTGFGGTCGKVK